MAFEIIAELHPQHGGDKGVLREMIRQAKQNGATVAKLQLYHAESLLGPDWNYLELSRDDTARVKEWCDEEEIEFMASVFDLERLGWLEELGVKRHKIASRTVVSNPELCAAILATGKETIVSLGNWDQPEKPFVSSDRIQYLYCKARYPAFYADLTDFPVDYSAEGLAGYSDHTIGIECVLIAIARGAHIIEKHMTLDKTRGKGTEKGHAGSMTPEELNKIAVIGSSMYRARRAIQAAQARGG